MTSDDAETHDPSTHAIASLCSRWKDQQKALWKAVGKATGWKASRCRHVQISELFSMEKFDQAVMDFLAATDVGMFPPKLAEERGQEEPRQD